MRKKLPEILLVDEWIRVLEGGNSAEFARKVHITPAAIYGWRRKNTPPAKDVLAKIRNAYNLTPEEYEAGPAEYQKKKMRLEDSKLMRLGDSDLERASRTYVNMHPNPQIRKLCGSHWAHRDEPEPKRYLHVLIDKNDKPLTGVKAVVVYELNVDENPEVGSRVMVWDGTETKIVRWTKKSKRSNYEKVWGPIIE